MFTNRVFYIFILCIYIYPFTYSQNVDLPKIVQKLPYYPYQGKTEMCSAFAYATGLTLLLNSNEIKNEKINKSNWEEYYVSPFYYYKLVCDNKKNREYNITTDIDDYNEKLEYYVLYKSYNIPHEQLKDNNTSKLKNSVDDRLKIYIPDDRVTNISFINHNDYTFNKFNGAINRNTPILLTIKVSDSFRKLIEQNKETIQEWDIQKYEIGNASNLHSILLFGANDNYLYGMHFLNENSVFRIHKNKFKFLQPLINIAFNMDLKDKFISNSEGLFILTDSMNISMTKIDSVINYEFKTDNRSNIIFRLTNSKEYHNTINIEYLDEKYKIITKKNISPNEPYRDDIFGININIIEDIVKIIRH